MATLERSSVFRFWLANFLFFTNRRRLSCVAPPLLGGEHLTFDCTVGDRGVGSCDMIGLNVPTLAPFTARIREDHNFIGVRLKDDPFTGCSLQVAKESAECLP